MTTEVLLEKLVAAFRAEANPVRAAGMSAYMRDQFVFLGIPTPLRRQLSRDVAKGLPKPDSGELLTVARACWEFREREFQYFAVDYTRRHIGRCGPEALDGLRYLIVTKPWWDTVDLLASRVVGPLVAAHPKLVTVLDEWSNDSDIWLARTAVLYQLSYGDRTDADRLFGYCAALADHPDFFIRKAIGWALRQYARTAPGEVREFVDSHELSPLSRREAMKHILSAA